MAASAILAGCAGSESRAGGTDAVVEGLRVTANRIRSDVGAALNGPDGWAGAVNESVSVRADEPFRIRFEVEAGAAASARLGLQVRRNGSEWLDVLALDFPFPDEISSPRVSIVATYAYAPGATTEDVIGGSTLPFRAGTGTSLDSVTAVWSGEEMHGEWEFPVVIRRFADGAETSEEGDTFEFRLVDAGGVPVGGSAQPRVRLAVPPRLLGGTFVETPGRLGPWQASNGDLHFVMEPAETDNVLMVVKSGDGGLTWREVDGANRPSTDDLEGFATDFSEGRIHMLHQTSDAVVHHVFRTSNASSTSSSPRAGTTMKRTWTGERRTPNSIR